MLLRSLPSSLQTPASNGLFSPNPPNSISSSSLPCSMFNQQVSNSSSLSQTLNDRREEEPCTPCTLWLSSLTSLQQLSLSSDESSNPNNQHNALDDSNIATTSTSSQTPSNFQEQIKTKSPVELFQEEFQLRCKPSLKTTTTTSSPNLIGVNAIASSPHSLLQSISVDASTNNIICKVLNSAVVKKTQLKQNKILKQRNKMSVGITNIIIPKQQAPSSNNLSVCIKTTQNK